MAKFVSIQAKASDCVDVDIHDEEGNTEYSYQGYYCGSDYIDFTIDFETGQIVGWEAHKKELLDYIEEQKLES